MDGTATDNPGITEDTASEFMVLFPLKPGSQERVREMLRQNDEVIASVNSRLQTIHEARWVLLPGDQYLMLATVFDGPWDRYIDDFATAAADLFDAVGAYFEGYPGALSGDKLRDYVRQIQVPADVFHFAYPNSSVRHIQRALRVDKAFQELLDASQS